MSAINPNDMLPKTRSKLSGEPAAMRSNGSANHQLFKSPFAEMAIEASEIVSRLEMATEGGSDPALRQVRAVPATVFLGLQKKSEPEIVDSLHSLAVQDEDGELLEAFPPQDDVSRLALKAHTLAAYCGSLERPTVQRLSAQLTADTTRWINQIFGYIHMSAYYHDDVLEGLVRITRMMLHCKYERYAEDGALALSECPPTIYCSITSPLTVLQHVCRQLALPLSCIRTVPVIGGSCQMDCSALQRMLADDRAPSTVTGRGLLSVGQRKPLLVLADAGTSITGHVDHLVRIRELCHAHDCWLHVRGHMLAALILPNYDRSRFQLNEHESGNALVDNADLNFMTSHICDSMTVPLGSWLGVTGLPLVTLYRPWETSMSTSSAFVASTISNKSSHTDTNQQLPSYSRENTAPLLAGLRTDHHLSTKITVLPLWFVMQKLGQDGIRARICANFMACDSVLSEVQRFRSLHILSTKPKREAAAPAQMCASDTSSNVSEFVKSCPSRVANLFESVTSCVVFQFVPDSNEGTIQSVPSRVPPYYDRLNSWLGQILQMDAPQVPIDIYELDDVGIVLRYCPFEGVMLRDTPLTTVPILETNDEMIPSETSSSSWDRRNIEDIPEAVKLFARQLEQQLTILRATIEQRAPFEKLVHESQLLRLVELPEWAGMGGVRYAPRAWDPLLGAADELDHVNVQLVEALRRRDSAFSLGETADGRKCVRFGMLTPNSDVAELVALVERLGAELEDRSRVLDSMGEIVKRGIEAATIELQRESEQQIWQQGILRHVPVVGTFVNWWSPLSNDATASDLNTVGAADVKAGGASPSVLKGIKGRSLDLRQGVVVASTETICMARRRSSSEATSVRASTEQRLTTSVQTVEKQTAPEGNNITLNEPNLRT